jgi:hypothetical protein
MVHESIASRGIAHTITGHLITYGLKHASPTGRECWLGIAEEQSFVTVTKGAGGMER